MAFTYDEYLARSGATDGTDGAYNESGQNTRERITEAQWEAMKPEDQYQVLRRGGGHQGGSGAVEARGDDAEVFRAKFGAPNWKPEQSGRPDAAGKFYTGYGKISDYGAEGGEDMRDYALDPSRILYLPDGRWVVEADNVNGEWLAKSQSTRADKRHRNAAIAGTIVVGGALAGMAGVGGAGVGAGEAVVPGAVAEGTIPIVQGAPIVDVGVLPGAMSETTLAAGQTAAGAGTTGIPSGLEAGPGTQAPAPVTNAVPSVPGTNTGGLIDSATQFGRQAAGWYNGLSPGSRFILNTAVSTGANALIGASAQRNAAQAADDRENQEREDRVRRGAVPDMSGAIKPRTNAPPPNPNTPRPGIVDGLRIPRIPRPGG